MIFNIETYPDEWVCFRLIDLNIMCRVIVCPEVRESCSLYIYIYIVCVEFLKELSFVCSLNE